MDTFEYKSRGYEAVFCDECGIKGEGYPCAAGDSKKLAIKAWNTRKPIERIEESLIDSYRKVECDEDLEWNRAIYGAIKIIRGDADA